MRARRIGHSVGRDHDETARERLADPLVLHHVNDHRTALLPVAAEGFLGQPLPGVLPLQIPVADPEVFRPAGVKDGRCQARRRGRVGIGLGGNVESAALHAADQVEDGPDVPQAGTVYMDDVKRRAGGDGIGDHLLHGTDLHVAHVRVDGRVGLGRELEDLENLLQRGAGIVLVRHPDAEGAFGEPAGECVPERGVVLAGDRVVAGCRTGRPELAQSCFGITVDHRAGPFQRRDLSRHGPGPIRHVRNGRAVVEDRALAPPRQKQGRARDTALHLERRGDPVTGLELVGAVRLPVRVQVDEAGRDDQPRDVDQDLAREGILRDRDDLPRADPDVADRVEARFGVHDAPSRQHDVVGVLGGEVGGGEKAGRRREGDGQRGGRGRVVVAGAGGVVQGVQGVDPPRRGVGLGQWEGRWTRKVGEWGRLGQAWVAGTNRCKWQVEFWVERDRTADESAVGADGSARRGIRISASGGANDCRITCYPGGKGGTLVAQTVIGRTTRHRGLDPVESLTAVRRRRPK